ncbi:MAG: hypothetical protein J0L53_17925 [Spirochaetes bacterium]|nr:hypothetical protein [Spirochaetota bacterium]
MGKLSKTAQRALSAYGGATIWQKAQRIEAIADVSGLAFRLKFRPLFRSVRIELKVHEPVSKITPIGSQPGLSGILQGHDVWLEDATGIIADSRPAARKYFPGGRRLFYWDELDMAYFANYAFWNYLTCRRY